MRHIIILLFMAFSYSIKSETFKKIQFVPLSNIHPTQAYIGFDQIPFKVKKIEKKFKKNNLKNYLKEKWAPAVIGPDHRYWIIDHHHLSYAVLKSNIPNKNKGLFIKVIFDWSKMNWSTFLKKMKDKSYIYLKDDNFLLIAFKNLPNLLEEMKDNPYRSLAYFSREKGCFKKVTTPFLEFIWGEYFFNQGVKIDDNRSYENAIVRSLQLCQNQSAQNLPGFILPKESPAL